jgi:acyl dehydratase
MMPETWSAGDEFPGIVIERSTLRQMVEWAAATDDFTEFHYDAESAAARGFDGPVVHGPLKAALLTRVIESAFGSCGVVRRFACRYVAPDIVGGELHAGGRVVSVDGTVATCELWIRNGDGEITVRGEAELALGAAG